MPERFIPPVKIDMRTHKVVERAESDLDVRLLWPEFRARDRVESQLRDQELAERHAKMMERQK